MIYIVGVNTEQRVEQAFEIIRKNEETGEFENYLNQLKDEDPIAFALVKMHMELKRYKHPSVIKRGRNLLSKLKDSPKLRWAVLMPMSRAYQNIGNMETAEFYAAKALDVAKSMQDPKILDRTELELNSIMFAKAEYTSVCHRFAKWKTSSDPYIKHTNQYLLAMCFVISGKLDKAFSIFEDLKKAVGAKDPMFFGALEMQGIVFRLKGEFSKANQFLLRAAHGHINYGSAYSAYPIAKALQIYRFTGAKPQPDARTVKEVVSLSRKGSWGERAAVQEIEALLLENDVETARGLLDAAENYLRVHNNPEAVMTGLSAAYMAWKNENPVFFKALNIVGPLLPLHPGFKKDSILGGFMSVAEDLLKNTTKPDPATGIRAYLIGGLKVMVDGKEIRVRKWYRNKAIKAFIYLLLSRKNRLPMDHLFYLLWPRTDYNPKTRKRLYLAISTVRKHIGRATLLTQNHDFYQLEDTWTDLGELEDLVRLADATQDPDQKEDYLCRARELAKGDLLPEFPYDSHIEEYRRYYRRLKRKLGIK